MQEVTLGAVRSFVHSLFALLARVDANVDFATAAAAAACLVLSFVLVFQTARMCITYVKRLRFRDRLEVRQSVSGYVHETALAVCEC